MTIARAIPCARGSERAMTRDAFAERIIAMQTRLYRVSASILRQQADREDAVQSSIELAWRKLPTLRDESRLEHWMTRILINECYTILRRQKRFIPVEQVPDAPAPPDADPDLYRFFTALPDKLRLPMTLHYIEGLDISAIADILRLPVGTVKTRLYRGREKMKQDQHLWKGAQGE